MKNYVSFLLSFTFFSHAFASEPTPIVVPRFENRTVQITLPDQYDGFKSWPLIVSLHGYGSSGREQAAYLGLSDSVSRDGFILLTPDGSKNTIGKTFWNAWSSCCNFDGRQVDDVGFIDALIKNVSKTYSVDTKRVYLVGHSNGAFFGYRFACEKPGVANAVIGLAGTMGPEACRQPTRTNVIHMHGTADTTIRYEGGSVAPTAPRYASATETAALWAGVNGCQSESVEDESLDLLNGDGFEGAETHVQKWVGCHHQSNVELWSIQNAPHVPNIFVPSHPFSRALIQKTLSLR